MLEYEFKHRMAVYNQDKELAGFMTDDFCVQEARHYYKGVFLGYNLNITRMGDMIGLGTFYTSDECQQAHRELLYALATKLDNYTVRRNYNFRVDF